MTRRSEQISLHLNAYLTAHSTPPDAILRELAAETAERYPNEISLQVELIMLPIGDGLTVALKH